MRTTLLHVSDLHFGSALPHISSSDFMEKMVACVLRELPEESEAVLAVTGDVTTYGRAEPYEEAAQCIYDELIVKLPIRKVLVCPGNHDITERQEPYFTHFNQFAFRITNDSRQAFSSSRSVCVVEHNGLTFLLVNTAYHGDHRRGEVKLRELASVHAKVNSENCVVLMHHSPLASVFGGQALTNGYEFMAWSARARLLAVLHGHIHTEQVLAIGSRPTALLGVGSLMFLPDANYNNQFSMITIENGRVVSASAYRYHADKESFVKQEIAWV